MELKKKRAKSTPKQIIPRYLFPITIISSILISGSIGYIASQIAVKNSISDSAEMHTIKNEMTEARNNSLKVIEKEIPTIISDLEKYNLDINLVSEKINWLEGNLAPIRDAADKFETAISVITGVNNFVDIPIVSKMENELAFAGSRLEEIDNLLLHMENLKVTQQEMNDSQRKLNLLYEEYKKEKNIEHLLQIEQELNSNLIYQIENLRTITMEAREIFALSSNVLVTVNNTKSLFNSIQEKRENTLDTIQFWKDNKKVSKIEANIKEDLEKDLATSKEELQNLPDKLAQQSKDSITSINNVQKELQIIKITQILLSE